VTRSTLPTRTLADRPDLEQLRRQAKELREAFRARTPDAVAEVTSHYRNAEPASFALHNAQLVLARAYGFQSWPKLKAYVEGATDQRLVAAVRAGDLAQVRLMLDSRPELAIRRGALHAAVLGRAPELVRVLMAHGADPRRGFYPHEEATNPLTIATERGYDEIVAIIRDEEQRRDVDQRGPAASTDQLFDAVRAGDDAQVRRLMTSDPSLVRVRQPASQWTPLHVAAFTLNESLVPWLLDHGAQVNAMARGMTPLDVAARSGEVGGDGRTRDECFAAVAQALLERAADLTASAAVALGNGAWLSARHADGRLTNVNQDSDKLLSLAVRRDRPEILALLLELGLDPDERHRSSEGDEVAFSAGEPLWYYADSGRYAMAQTLLEHGADPNANVEASGTPVFIAYGQSDRKMVALLEQHGGVADPNVAGYFRETDLAVRLLAEAADQRVTAERLLDAAACGGDPEIVRLALEHVDWPRDDARWFAVLEQPVRCWNRGAWGWGRPRADWDSTTYRVCFGLILERCDPNIRGRITDGAQLGLTILHSVAGLRKPPPDERVGFATLVLDAGGRLGLRDNLLQSTPLGWACRWGRVELVELLLSRGVDPVEADAHPWATPEAWARKMDHGSVLTALQEHGRKDS
jgi:ankyrin repeat protein